MDLEIIPARIDDQTTFRNLFQFYLYDFSHFMHWPVTYGGRYIEDDLEGCWTSETRHPFLFRLDAEWCGLAIISEDKTSPYTGEKNRIAMSEFFIMAGYRRRGVGRKAATTLFDRYHGTWEVFQMRKNLDAVPFWRAVIRQYTGGNFQELASPLEDGTVQVFDHRPR